MGLHTIKKGWHYSLPLLVWPFWVGNATIRRRVSFHDDCQYELPAYYAENANKLFGLCFGWLPRRVQLPENQSKKPTLNGVRPYEWVSPGHYNSIRYSWLWSPKYEAWKLLSYAYVKGIKNWDEQMRYPEVAKVAPGTSVDCFLSYARDSGIAYLDVQLVLHTDFCPMGSVRTLLPQKLSRFGLIMGFFFGGFLPTPHTMSADITRS